jgi:hypothetical protein
MRLVTIALLAMGAEWVACKQPHPRFGAIPLPLHPSIVQLAVVMPGFPEVLECGNDRSPSPGVWERVCSEAGHELGLLGFSESSLRGCAPVRALSRTDARFLVVALVESVSTLDPRWEAVRSHSDEGVFVLTTNRALSDAAPDTAQNTTAVGACVCAELEGVSDVVERVGRCFASMTDVSRMSVREWWRSHEGEADALRRGGCASYVCRVGRGHHSIVGIGSEHGRVAPSDREVLRWAVLAQASHPDNALTSLAPLMHLESRVVSSSAVGCFVPRGRISPFNMSPLSTCRTREGSLFQCEGLGPLPLFEEGSAPESAHRFLPEGVFGRTPRRVVDGVMLPLRPPLSMDCPRTWTLLVTAFSRFVFEPLAQVLAEGLRENGIDATVQVCTDEPGPTHCNNVVTPELASREDVQWVVLGLNQVVSVPSAEVRASLLVDWTQWFPRDTIAMNLDVLCESHHVEHEDHPLRSPLYVEESGGSPWVESRYLSVLRGFHVWDYSHKSSECLAREHGVMSERVALSGYARAWYDWWDCEVGEDLRELCVDCMSTSPSDAVSGLMSPPVCTEEDHAWVVSEGVVEGGRWRSTRSGMGR